MFVLQPLLAALAVGAPALTQGPVQLSPTYKLLDAKPRPMRLSSNQKRALLTAQKGSGDFSSSGTTIYSITPKNLLLPSKASLNFWNCAFYWPAADSAYFIEPDNANGGPSIGHRFFVPAGTRHVILSFGLRLAEPTGKDWRISWTPKSFSGPSGQQVVKTQGNGFNTVASAVFQPSRGGWYEGHFSAMTGGVEYFFDFFEATFVK